ncbi:MAG: nicotinate (nicotinamide) nucleotide adenylyltransferase [Desulfovibrionaceae bacterium]
MSTTTAPARLGVLGGSFNPVHNGHLRMAVEALEQLRLDRVELVPAAHPPHKDDHGLLPFARRLRLTELAAAGHPALAASPIESLRPGPSFTCDTLTCYRTQTPAADLFFILGSATFLELPTWRRWQDLPTLADLVVVGRWDVDDARLAAAVAEYWPRAEREAEGLWRFPTGHALHRIRMPRLDIKAADLRRRWREGHSLCGLVPAPVAVDLAKDTAEIEAAWGARITG